MNVNVTSFTASPAFQNQFFARTLRQSFNTTGGRFNSDEDETGIHKWLRVSGNL